MKNVASPKKVAYHREKLDAYLRGESIYPATLELDITSKCTRACNDCPSCRSSFQKSLSFNFITKLLNSLNGQTKGLLLTGGEPTMSSLFPATLELARKNGFEDIAVVTNGSLLGDSSVADALLEHASTIRLSMYDWDGESCNGIEPTLRRIEELRKKIDSRRSSLKIGISALTSMELSPRLTDIADSVRAAGAHWIYYHPMCSGWSDGNLLPFDQNGVLDTIRDYQRKNGADFDVFVCSPRYDENNIEFNGYHAAHFLLIIGADGINYLGAEVKYQERFALYDVAGNWRADFLHSPERLQKMKNIKSATYSALKSRHRGVLYSDYIEKLMNQREADWGAAYAERNGNLLFPHIL